MSVPSLDPIPNTDPDLTIAARRYIAGIPGVTALLGPGTFISSLPLTQTYSTWIFRWAPYVDIENTGQACIVLSQSTGWTAPNSYNTMQFPVLQVEIMVDATRDNNLEPVTVIAQDRAIQIFKAIDPYLHLVDARGVYFDTLRIVESSRQSQPAPISVPGKDSMVNMIVRYNITL